MSLLSQVDGHWNALVMNMVGENGSIFIHQVHWSQQIRWREYSSWDGSKQPALGHKPVVVRKDVEQDVVLTVCGARSSS